MYFILQLLRCTQENHWLYNFYELQHFVTSSARLQPVLTGLIIMRDKYPNFCISNQCKLCVLPYVFGCHHGSLKLSECRLHQRSVPSCLYRGGYCRSFWAWTLSRSLSFISLNVSQSGQSCRAASAMQHCTYTNLNRVMTGGYPHAVGLTLLCRDVVCCVIWAAVRCQNNKSPFHWKP